MVYLVIILITLLIIYNISKTNQIKKQKEDADYQDSINNLQKEYVAYILQVYSKYKKANIS